MTTRPAIRTPDQRLRVFVSSTMKELAAERVAVKDAVSALRLAPVLFETGARPHPPRDLYRAYLEQSDIFVSIYGCEYGWIAPDMDISGIEDEWQLSSGMPRLVYVKESPERDPRLREMLDRIGNDGGVSYKRFRDADELREIILDDLALLITERFHPAAAASPDGSSTAASTTRADSPEHQLPTPPNVLIGREDEVRTLSGLLLRNDIRLVTLVGAGGAGKTRLALEVARRIGNQFTDGAAFVPLADVRDGPQVPSAIAKALGISGDATAETLTQELNGRSMLLVLDNFEHLLDGAATVGELVAGAPGVTQLVTSRAPLGVYGEREIEVGPLALPGRDAAIAAIESSPAVQLFVERAQWVRRDFALTPDNAADVAAICSGLDGLPLAIELAAARVRVLPPRAILQRINERLDATPPAGPGRPARQQTMRAAIAWSYDLLDEREQRLFAWLAVFAGGFDVTAVEAVCGGVFGTDVIDVVGSLVAKSLVRVSPTDDGEPRFELLQLMREYAWERLEERGEAPDARDAHAAQFAAFAAGHESTMITSSTKHDRRPLDREYPNMRDALLWSIERLSAHEEASRWLEGLLATLYFYWYMSRGPNDGRSEGRVLSERALAAARATSDQRALAISLFALGSQAMWSELPEAVMWMEESSGLWRKLGDQHRLGLAKMLAGITALRRGHGDDADRHLVEAADLLRRVHDMPALGVVMMHRGDLANARGDLTEARAHLVEALAIQRQSGGGWTTAAVLNSLGELERAAGDHAAAGEHYREALARFSAVRAPNDVTRSIHALGYVALRAGDSAAARRRFETAKSRFAQAHNRRGLAEATFGLAGVHASDGEWEQAARLIGAADRALEEVGVQPWPADARERERDLARIAAAIGERALQRELTAGREMGLTQYLST